MSVSNNNSFEKIENSNKYNFNKILNIDFRTNYYFKNKEKIKIELTVNDLIHNKDLIGIHHKIEFKQCHYYADDMKKNLGLCNNPNFLMLWKPRDISWKLGKGYISKSRPINGENNILLLLYHIRHYPEQQIKLACNDKISFKNKIKTAVWRGAITGFENVAIRSKFNLETDIWNNDKLKYNDINEFVLNKNIPSRFNLVNKYYRSSVVNVGFTNGPNYMIKYIGDYRYKIKNRLRPEHLLRYKYLISIEGNDVASNLKWLFASKCLILMPKPTCETWFCEGLLEPWVHYIPLENNLADLYEKINWCERNTKFCEQIIENQRVYFAIMYDKQLNNKITKSILKKYYENVEFTLKKTDLENLDNKQKNIVSSFLKYDNVKLVNN